MKNKLVTWRWAWMIAAVSCSLAFASARAQSQNMVESVTSQVQGGVEMVSAFP